MSTGKTKLKRDFDTWKECLLCNLIIPAHDEPEHHKWCQGISTDLNYLHEKLGIFESHQNCRSPKSPSENTRLQKCVTPKRLFQDNSGTPDSSVIRQQQTEISQPSTSNKKSCGFSFRHKLFGVFSALPSKGIDVKNVPAALQSDLVHLHPSAMRICGIGIGDTVLLTTARFGPRMGYAWPNVSAHPANVSFKDKQFSVGETIVVELYPLAVASATHLSVCVPSVDDRRLEDKLSQVLKIHLCNHFVTERSEFTVNFFGRQVSVTVLEVAGHEEQNSIRDDLKVADDLAESFDMNCCIEDLSVETQPTTPSTISPVSGFRTVSFTPQKEVIDKALQRSLPTFYRVSYSTRVSVDNYPKPSARKLKKVSYQDTGGLDEIISSIKDIINLVFRAQSRVIDLGVPVPKGLVLYGPPGTGKTLLANAIRDEEGINFASLSGPDIFSKYYGETESKLKRFFEEAVEKGPSIIFLDDVNVLCPKREQSTDQEKRFLNALLQLIDNIEFEEENLLIIAATNRLEDVDLSLRRPGRLDRLIEVPVPTPAARIQILNKLLSSVKHSLTSEEIQRIAESAHSFTGGDLAVMVREAVQSCLQNCGVACTLTAAELSKIAKEVKPSAMKEVTLEVPKVYWNDIGGQEDLKLKLRQSVEWPLKHPEAFRRLGISPPHGLLMYGPPGCSKTLIAKALATESGLNFLAIKGPELFNKWVGESERAVREVFRKARAAAPSVVFFDEIDALAAERSGGAGHGDGGSSVGNRVLAQLLNEMDGVEALEGVTVVAATNRPDMIDKALLRPGRLDRVVYVPLPDAETRREILRLQMRKMPIAKDIDLELLVSRTEGFSGAEVVAVCQEAGLVALSESLSAESIRGEHFEQALQVTQPRTDKELVQFYEKYHSQGTLGHL